MRLMMIDKACWGPLRLQKNATATLAGMRKQIKLARRNHAWVLRSLAATIAFLNIAATELTLIVIDKTSKQLMILWKTATTSWENIQVSMLLDNFFIGNTKDHQGNSRISSHKQKLDPAQIWYWINCIGTKLIGSKTFIWFRSCCWPWICTVWSGE